MSLKKASNAVEEKAISITILFANQLQIGGTPLCPSTMQTSDMGDATVL